jgi:blue copper oxidase
MVRRTRGLTRRRLLLSAATLLLPIRSNASERIRLPIPALVDASSGPILLEARRATHQFLPGRPTESLGYSSTYLGPTLRFRSGRQATLSVVNRLDKPTTTHLHGLLIPAASDGAPHRPVAPGEAWQTSFRVDQPATTAWYHAHPHGDTGRQVYMGLAGMAIIDDADGPNPALPFRYGVDDLPLILQDRALDPLGRSIYRSDGHAMMMGMRGETLVVNGAVDPVATVPAGLVRLRILNGANARNFDLAFEDQRVFHVIAGDCGLLAAPVARRTLIVAPGERFEIVVDFSDGRPANLETASDTAAVLAARMPNPSRMMGRGSGRLLSFEVVPSMPAHTRPIPQSLARLASPVVPAGTVRRVVSLDMGPSMMGQGMAPGAMRHGPGGMHGINGRTYDPERIDFEIPLGSTEIWEVRPQMMAHPFHIHGVTFRVLSLGGAPPPDHLAGDKDTVLVDRPTELLVRFAQRATHEMPFMFHCHVLEHEDAGMMAQFRTE